jgi:hypothetical protein
MLKTRPKQILGFLPLDIALPGPSLQWMLFCGKLTPCLQMLNWGGVVCQHKYLALPVKKKNCKEKQSSLFHHDVGEEEKNG